MSLSPSINERALQILRNFTERPNELGCKVTHTTCGATLVDAGIEVAGSVEAGRLIGKTCMGGLAAVRIVQVHIGDMTVQGVMVATQEPVIATLGSQLARWRLRYPEYSAMGSGPAQARAGVETNLFDNIGYADDGDCAVLVLETREYPPDNVLESIADTCDVLPSNLYCVLVPTASIVGSVQIAARTVEVGIYRLYKLGMKPSQFRSGYGVAPFRPKMDDDYLAMVASNECLAYGGRAHFFVTPEEDINLEEMVQEACSNYSESHGKSFSKLYKDAKYNPNERNQRLFSPAQVSIMDINAEMIYRAGEINVVMVRKALGHI
ncbi:MAG: methenyltetrahydromethanopterin cyclohydrolase [Promethearchaeia archaeon]